MTLKRFLRVKAKMRDVRGYKDAAVSVELLKNNWNEIADAFESISEDEQNELLDHFN